MKTPGYIKSLVTPTAKKETGRKIWAIDLATVWLPFFTATNAQGDTAIPSAALGAPVRLAYDKAGAVRFGQSGRPVLRVAKELGDQIRTVRENVTANLLNFTGAVIRDNAEGYKAQIDAAHKAGQPITQHDSDMLSEALETILKAQAEADAKAKAEAEAKSKAEAEADKSPELVTA